MEDEVMSLNERYPQRIGMVTSSQIKTVLNGWSEAVLFAESNKEKAGQVRYPAKWSDGAHTYARRLALDLMGYIPDTEPSSFATRWGHDYEPVSRKKYAEIIGADISGEFFRLAKVVPGTGSTPDGAFMLEGRKCLFEAKCPQEDAMLKALEQYDEDHYLQVQHQMMCTGADETHLVYYHPFFPPKIQRKVYIIQRDEELMERMKTEITRFRELVDYYTKLYNGTRG